MKTTSFKTIAIIGLGLIGGSLGKRIIRKLPDTQVIGVDKDPNTIKIANQKKIVHIATTNIKLAVKKADLVILATPIEAIFSQFIEASKHAKKGTIIIDVASTKSKIVSQIETISSTNVYFVGGHPMAGSEKTGILSADHKILKKACFVLTQTQKTNKKAIKKLIYFIETLGMRSLVISPDIHDLLVAAVSHLPYLVSISLTSTINNLSSYKKEISQLVAGGFRDTTRIASSCPIWAREVLTTNHVSITNLLDIYNQQLHLLINKLQLYQYSDLEDYFRNAKIFRDSIYEER